MRLIEPAAEWREAFLEMARDWRAAGEARYVGVVNDFEGYLRRLELQRRGEGLPPHHVPGTDFWLEEAGTLLGGLRLRFRLNAELQLEGGHIGYDVRPSARRRGYGTQLLGLGLIEARARGISPVLVTVDADNLPSIRVIERNGGIFSGENRSPTRQRLIRQYWIHD